MTLRTPTPFLSQQASLDLQRVKERMAILDRQITTGKRIVRAGDDPSGAAALVDFRSSIARNDSYLRQIDGANVFLESAATSLQGVSDQITQLLAAGTQALGYSASGRQGAMPEVQGLRANLIALANRQEQGKYLFAGTQTTTQPFSDASVTPTTYSGDAGTIALDYNMGISVITNVPGSEVFQGSGGQGSSTDLFKQVDLLLDGLNTNDTAKIQTSMQNLQAIFGTVQAKLTEVGGRQQALEQMKTSLGDFNISLKSIQNDMDGVDYPQAWTDYQQATLSHQAALSMMGKSSAIPNLFSVLT
ncbi:MAG: flagellar hook-associated protein FlgL [Firmicutes bacterium]|nr:flagellar hook-associated protein FlgL [Bacillota bacterium]